MQGQIDFCDFGKSRPTATWRQKWFIWAQCSSNQCNQLQFLLPDSSPNKNRLALALIETWCCFVISNFYSYGTDWNRFISSQTNIRLRRQIILLFCFHKKEVVTPPCLAPFPTKPGKNVQKNSSLFDCIFHLKAGCQTCGEKDQRH